ncbi:MAG TPA: hypothetical protein VF808_17180 [Ktedonobacterales bacterium]
MDFGYTTLFRAVPDLIALGRRRARLRLLTVMGVIAPFIFLSYSALTAIFLWLFWPLLFSDPTPSQQPLSALTSLTLGGMVTLLLLQNINTMGISYTVGLYRRPLPALTFAQALMAAIIARDPAVAPAADARQAERDASVAPHGQGFDASQPIGPVAHPAGMMGSSDGAYIAGIVGGFALAGLGLVMATLPTLVTYFHPGPNFGALPSSPLPGWLTPYQYVVPFWGYGAVVILAGGFLSAWVRIAWRFGRLEREGFTARVDAQGLRIQYAEEPAVALAWNEVRGFAHLRYRDDWVRDHDVYLLLTNDRALLWEAPPQTRYISFQGAAREAAQRAAAYQLVERVRTDANIPLVDVSEIISLARGGVTSSSSTLSWNLAGRGAYLARQRGDGALAQSIWARLHPGSRMPGPRGMRAREGITTAQASQSHSAEEVRAARSLLPYLPTPEDLTRSVGTRFLSRVYWRYTQAWLVVLMLWALAQLAFSFVHLRFMAG